MTTVVKPKTELVVPSTLQRQAGIKTGDRLQFKVSPRTIVITAISQPAYKPISAELTAIRKGEAVIARGDYVTLTDFLHEMGRTRGITGAKAARKILLPREAIVEDKRMKEKTTYPLRLPQSLKDAVGCAT